MKHFDEISAPRSPSNVIAYEQEARRLRAAAIAAAGQRLRGWLKARRGRPVGATGMHAQV